MTNFFNALSGLFAAPRPGSGPAFLELNLLRDRFEDSRPLYSSRIAVAFDAEDTVLRKRVVLWTLRKPLQPASEEAVSLVGQLTQSFPCQVRMPAVLNYGIDMQGTCFYVTELPTARPILQITERSRSATYYITNLIRILAKLHADDIVLGSIGDDSFLADHEGRVSLNGLFSSRAVRNVPFEGNVNASFLAPEQIRGHRVTPAADVFAFGAFVYKLLSRRDFPSGLTDQQQYEHLRGQLPVICRDGTTGLTWLQPILEKCLQWRPENRYASAVELLDEYQRLCPESVRLTPGSTLQFDSDAAVRYLLSPTAQLLTLMLIVVIGMATAYQRYLHSVQRVEVDATTTLSSPQRTTQGVAPARRLSLDPLAREPSSSESPRVNPFAGTMVQFGSDEEEAEMLDRLSGAPEEVSELDLAAQFSRGAPTNFKRAVKADELAPTLPGRAPKRAVARLKWWEHSRSPMVSLIKTGSIGSSREVRSCRKK